MGSSTGGDSDQKAFTSEIITVVVGVTGVASIIFLIMGIIVRFRMKRRRPAQNGDEHSQNHNHGRGGSRSSTITHATGCTDRDMQVKTE